MKICVYGAGAIGGHLAMRLHKAGAEVSIIARGPHLEAIQTQGLTVHAVDAAKGLILVKGAIPGPKGGLVLVRTAAKGA